MYVQFCISLKSNQLYILFFIQFNSITYCDIMASSSYSSAITCEIKIVGAKNVRTKHKGSLFVRCYLTVGSNNRRIQINTKEVSSYQKDDYIFWDDSFSLECNGSRDSIQGLKAESVFFELRWRNKKSFLGNIGSSQLVATAEVPWKNVFDAPKMEVQKWVFMSVSQGDNNNNNTKVLKVEDGVKPPALQIAMKVASVPAATAEEMRKRRRSERLKRLDDCACRSQGEYCSCIDNELLLIGAALDGF